MRSSRCDWHEAMVILGALGYRPVVTPGGLLANRPDGSTLRLKCSHRAVRERRDGQATVILTNPSGRLEFESTIFTTDREEILDHILEVDDDRPPHEASIPRRTVRDIKELAVTYAEYSTEMNHLAQRGMNAYIDDGPIGLRMYSAIGDSVLIDISIDDEGLPLLGPDGGSWVVFISSRDGYLAEFEIDIDQDRVKGAIHLAAAVAEELGHVLFTHPRATRS